MLYRILLFCLLTTAGLAKIPRRIHIHGQDIRESLTESGSLIIAPTESQHMSLTCKKGTVETHEVANTERLNEYLQTSFDETRKGWHNTIYITETTWFPCSQGKFDGRIAGTGRLHLGTQGAVLDFYMTYVDGPTLCLTGNKHTFTDFFVMNSHNLYIQSNSPDALIQLIVISFENNLCTTSVLDDTLFQGLPSSLYGELDLESGDIHLDLYGIKSISITFNKELLA